MLLCAAPAIARAQAQQPSEAQIAAIRSSCRSDFMADCSCVRPGGKDALNCLQRNLATLSPLCKAAVSAIRPALAAPATPVAPVAVQPAAVTAPPPGPPATAAAPPLARPAVPKPPVSAAPAAAVPPPTHEAKTPAASHPKAPVAATMPAPAVAARPANEPAQAMAPAAPPPAPAVAPLALRPFILPQRRLVILAICGGDARRLCAGTPPGGERILKCLAAQASRVSPNCYAALSRVSRK